MKLSSAVKIGAAFGETEVENVSVDGENGGSSFCFLGAVSEAFRILRVFALDEIELSYHGFGGHFCDLS